MNETRLKVLRRLALSPLPQTSSQLCQKLRAMDQLAKLDGRIPVVIYREHLELAMENNFGSYEGARASSMAGQLMDWMDQCEAEAREEWPSKTPDEPVTVGYWPYDGSNPDLAGWEELDMDDTFGGRDRHRRKLVGDPPWRPGEVRVPDDDDDDPDDDYDSAP
jgi:hypothetical protein